MEIAQKEKSVLLQRAVLNSSVEELSEICDELGFVEMSAPALGLACRFRGLEVVKLLVQKGASFDFPSTQETAEAYDCYIGTKKGDYRTNYSVYLLKAFGKHLPIYCLAGMVMEQHASREDGNLLSFLSDQERVDVLRYLLENREKIAFYPEELLYYAIFYRDTALVMELKMQNVKIPERRVHVIADVASAPSGYWDEYVYLTKQLADVDYLEVMQQLVSELDGRLFRYTEGIFDATKRRFCDGRVFEFFYSHFKREKMNKRAIMCGLIDEEALEAFPIVEREGWLAMPKKRDEMIAYASEKGKTEILAWLLEYKNRTADLTAEQEKAEKKLMRELNRAPDSVDALKKLWSYRKQEDGTLIVTNYKGTDIEVTVPEKIGKSIVTAVGNGAFAGRHSDVNPKITSEQMKQHSRIVKITLPGTLQYIGSCAFYQIRGLEEVHIPEGLEAIGRYAFYGCVSIKNITIPDKVKRIGEGAFKGCSSLGHITIPDQVKKIGMRAFEGCSSLEQITIPEGMEEIGTGIFGDCCLLKNVTIPGTIEKISVQAFFGCNHLEKVNICEGVRGIGRYAFNGCYSLTNITIPKTVEEIGAYAFGRCRKLEDVRMGERVREIGEYAFQNCAALKNIRIPETVEKIGRYAFSGCQELAELCISEGIKEISEYVFNNCSALKNITIPKTVEKIGAYAFQNCVLLKSITIPEAVEEIGKGVFTGCSNLEEVCICGEVKKIGAEAFSGCQNLKEIRILQAIPNRTLGETIEQCPKLTISCPKGSKTERYCKKKGIPCTSLKNDRGQDSKYSDGADEEN